ncbi:TOBE domain-containing protein [Adhaeribacter rhizoryzae]|uniref:Tobe domain protein n=1 Tax=Adhaeribacter rhizoryzae TaxID=2607907 RepID=A0A5M6DK53_9BACT|nr:TOBE domain-containing protein [Adhaeribacter rhizoryzae]KAA5545685.1 tobe domain protein [Adhaeribacter rhizoryzae]
MNRLAGVIKSITTEKDISLVTVSATGETFSALIIDTPQTAAYLKPNQEINMVFKETEMAIGKNLTGGLSLRNRFAATVQEITAGTVLSRIILDFKGHLLCAIITTQSVTDLQLAVGDSVVGLVKTNEISLMEGSF